MTYRERPPLPPLHRSVDRIWWRTSAEAGDPAVSSAAPGPTLILPDGCIDVLVDVRTGIARVVGTMTRAVEYSLPPGASLAAVRFKPGAAPGFLRVGAAELTDRVVQLDDLGTSWLPRAAFDGIPLPRAVADLERRLLERVGSLSMERTLSLEHTVSMERAMGHAARRLYGDHPPSIAELASELRLSRQHLRRSFREHVGVTPKRFAQVARLQRAVDHLQSARTASLARVALELGYSDQAHMSHDFRELAGITPRRVVAAKGSISPIRSLWLEA
jgi:AraC-like DNA-binding protein